jgi:hypothetical protein
MFPEDDAAPAADEQPTPPTDDSSQAPDTEEEETPPEGEEEAGEGEEEAEDTETPFAKGVREEQTRSADGKFAKAGEKPEIAQKPGEKPPKTPPKGSKIDPVEAEIKAFGLKDAAARRFRELSARAKPEETAALQDKAGRFDNWVKVLSDTKSTNQQLSNALGYLGAINSREPSRMNAAFDSMLAELQWLGGQIGREVPGFVDPIEGHRDLADALEKGQITREYALQIARGRAGDARRSDLQKQQQAEQQQMEQIRRDAQNALDTDVKRVNDKYAAFDPHFEAKVTNKRFVSMVQWIRDNVPIPNWGNAVDQAYQMMEDPKVEERKPAPGPMPLRPTGASGGDRARKFKNPLEAFRAGVREAR